MSAKCSEKKTIPHKETMRGCNKMIEVLRATMIGCCTGEDQRGLIFFSRINSKMYCSQSRLAWALNRLDSRDR